MNDFQRLEENGRRQIRELLDHTLFVEAGAGTGKTRTLVDRFVSLVLNGRPVDRIVAITFTEKAAAELRQRIRTALETTNCQDRSHRERIARALESLDRAEISTIHGFCHGLLRTFAAHAGVDPSFVVADEVMAERRFQERWRLYLEGLASDAHAARAIDRALRLGMTPRSIEDLARAVRERQDLLSLVEKLAVDPPEPPALDVGALQSRLASVDWRSVPEDDLLRQRFEELQRQLDRLARQPGNEDVMLTTYASAIQRGVDRAGNQRHWGGAEGIAAARRVASDIIATLSEALESRRRQALAGLLPVVCRFLREDADARAREGVMEFDDLILRVRDLLRAEPKAAKALRQRYDVMLIDEFQDTDPLQVEIAVAFATSPETGQLESGRLFLVGDPKQSIYRFRRADMAVYARTREQIERERAKFPQLVMNRRCRRPIVEWVNAVFAPLIGNGERPRVQPPYHPIAHTRDVDLWGPGVAWFGGELDANAPQVRRTEADAVASCCWQAVSERWEVADGDGAPRTACFRDIAILIPTRTSLGTLERALQRARIPYRVEGGSLVYRTQEVRDLINCLTAIDDPADEVAIVGALRSPAFACSDVDIARFRADEGRFDYLRPDLDGRTGPVADALRALREYHHQRHDGSLAALVERIARERGLAEIGILDRGDRNSFRRVRFVAEQARRFEADGPRSLRAFITWLERRATRENVLDHEGAGIDDDEDAVRVLTIHGAKGLEFPIVILAGLGVGPPPNTAILTADRDSERLNLRLGTSSRRFEIGDPALPDAEREHEAAERDRLLYVAATRARDHLLVSLYHKKDGKDCFARRLISAGAQSHAPERPARPASPGSGAPFVELQVDLPDDADVERFHRRRRDLVASAARQRYASATSLKQLQPFVSDAPDEEHPADEEEPWARGKGSTRLGRAVHATIQSVGLNADDATVAAFARAQAVAEAIPDCANEVVTLVRKALTTEAARRARSAVRAVREAPFVVKVDGVTLEGFVDLLIETPDGLEIVDWKTDYVPLEAVDHRLETYRLQAGLYVLGVEAATGTPVRAVTYVFVQPGVERSLGRPAELAQLARNVLAQSVGSV